MTDTSEWGRIKAVAEQQRARREAERQAHEDAVEAAATPETIRRFHASVAARMQLQGQLGIEQLRAAGEISKVYEKLTAGLWARAADMSRVPGRSLNEDWPASLRRAYTERYAPWRDAAGLVLVKHRTSLFDLVAAFAIENRGPRQIADRVGMDQRRVLRLVRNSLYDYAERAGWVDHVGAPPAVLVEVRA